LASFSIFGSSRGQWVDDTWADATSGAGIYQNTWRWYAPSIGRYSRPDPLPIFEYFSPYLFANGNPVFFVDPLGLAPKCVEPSGFHYIGPGSLLHRLSRFHNANYFNVLWYNTDCPTCQSPTDITVAPSPKLAAAPPGIRWLYSLLNPQREFAEKNGRGNNLRIGVSVQTRFAGWSGPDLFRDLGRLVLVCYDCQ
jgi:RHS repeat-associated protein